MNKLLSSFLIIAFVVVSALSTYSAHAAIDTIQPSPYGVIENVGNKLFIRIADNQQELEKFPGLMQVIVDEELMPYVDYKYAAYKILGKNLRKTTPEQREKFVSSMRSYLVRTYATVLEKYNNQQVVYEHEKNFAGKKIVSVGTQIVDSNQPSIDLVFKMRLNKKTKEWKAFDMVVEGISLLNSKQAELSQRISKQGVEKVTLELASIAR